MTRHEDVVDVATTQQELGAQYALDLEAAGLVKSPGSGVATQHPQAQLARPAAGGLLDSGLDEPSSGALAPMVGVNAEPIDLQNVIMGREADGPAQLRVPDDHAVKLGHEHVLGRGSLVEERRTRWRCRARGGVIGPGGGVQPRQGEVVPRLSSANRYHRNRMAQRRRSANRAVMVMPGVLCWFCAVELPRRQAAPRESGYSIHVPSHRDLPTAAAGDSVTNDGPTGADLADHPAGPSNGGALSGLLVADFGRVLAGPYATMLMADLGAEVIKVERPGSGDDTRSWGPPWANGQATYFQGVNRNKASVSIDLGTEAGLTAARDLASRADVVVENFRPGVMARLGLDHETLSRANPRLVYCSISGFGSGTGAKLPGYDLLAQAVGGLMSVTGAPDGEPTKVGVALVDVITGLHAAVGILAAVRHAERTGQGQLVEVNLLSSLLSALTNQAQGFVGAGVVPARMGNRHPSISPYETFPTKDRLLVLAVGNDRQFEALCRLLDLAEAARDPRFVTNEQRVAHREALSVLLSERLVTQSADHWFRLLMAKGVPCGPINSIAEGFALATELGLDPVVLVPAGDASPRGVATVANPIRLSATPVTYRSAPPRLGQHNSAGLGPQESEGTAPGLGPGSSAAGVSS